MNQEDKIKNHFTTEWDEKQKTWGRKTEYPKTRRYYMCLGKGCKKCDGVGRLILDE